MVANFLVVVWDLKKEFYQSRLDEIASRDALNVGVGDTVATMTVRQFRGNFTLASFGDPARSIVTAMLTDGSEVKLENLDLCIRGRVLVYSMLECHPVTVEHVFRKPISTDILPPPT